MEFVTINNLKELVDAAVAYGWGEAHLGQITPREGFPIVVPMKLNALAVIVQNQETGVLEHYLLDPRLQESDWHENLRGLT